LYLPKGAYGSGTPIVRIDDYQTDWIRPVAELRRVRAAESQVSTWALQPGDLLVNRVNSMSHLGKCVVIPNALGGALFESNMMRFRLVPGVLPRYVELYLGSKIGKRCLTADAKWAVNQASINQKDVQATEIPLPSLDRQAHIIGEVDRRLSIVREVAAKVDANLKRTAALRQAVLSRVFQATSETESAQ
jgi:type I restriction enzyme S subunit